MLDSTEPSATDHGATYAPATASITAPNSTASPTRVGAVMPLPLPTLALPTPRT